MNSEMTSKMNCRNNQRFSAFVAIVALFLAALAMPSYGQTIIPLPTQPADNWNLNVGVGTGGACYPVLNPMETAFLDVATPAGPGVLMAATSTTCGCCSCIRRSREYPLGFTLNSVADAPRLQGWYAPDRDPSDAFSVTSFRVDLVSAGFVVATQVFAKEIRPNNNCTAGGPTTIVSAGNFDIPLSSVGSADFDEIRVHAMGYACCPASNTIAVAGLTLFVP